MDLLRSTTGRVLISAHRGASGYAPENTLAAFRLAKMLGADMVELDVHLSRDDRLVVVHDDTLERTTDGSGYVRDQTWDQLAKLDAGRWFGSQFTDERIPLFEEVLAWAADAAMPLSIELKQPNAALGREAYPDLAERVIDQVRAYHLADQVVLFSDHHGLVRIARDTAPEIGTAIVLGTAAFIDPVDLARQAGADGVAIYWRFASRSLVEACHAASVNVFGYGVGDDLSRTAELGAMLANGTDLVSSGEPDRLRGFVDTWLAAAVPH